MPSDALHSLIRQVESASFQANIPDEIVVSILLNPPRSLFKPRSEVHYLVSRRAVSGLIEVAIGESLLLEVDYLVRATESQPFALVAQTIAAGLHGPAGPQAMLQDFVAERTKFELDRVDGVHEISVHLDTVGHNLRRWAIEHLALHLEVALTLKDTAGAFPELDFRFVDLPLSDDRTHPIRVAIQIEARIDFGSRVSSRFFHLSQRAIIESVQHEIWSYLREFFQEAGNMTRIT